MMNLLQSLEMLVEMAIQCLKLRLEVVTSKKRVEKLVSGRTTRPTADHKEQALMLYGQIKSVVSRYKDLVGIYPMNKLTADKL